MTEAVSILGSTGSIGCQTLEVCAHLGLKVKALTAGRNRERLCRQARQFRPEMVSLEREEDAGWLRRELADVAGVQVLHGREGNLAAAAWDGADTVVAAMVGVAGLEPVLAAVRAGRTIALANKETLVAGGALVMPLLERCGARLYPVDSEHSAIWQCLAAAPSGSLKRILLTASGGPFRGRGPEQLAGVTVAEALRHPTWTMGGKITIDSATLMNKGLEVIEASWLFGCAPDRIQVVVHPQSIIHSMVELHDGSVLAQMGFPDMKLPIQLALTWPERLPTGGRPFDPFAAGSLTFEPPDLKTFRLLGLAYDAARTGGTLPAVMNAANEAAVGFFLAGRIGFTAIADLVATCMDRHLQSGFMTAFRFDDMMEQDLWARTTVRDLADRHLI
ncbi:MAG: 1-deoxy-D-xylulose-5-phosphate reductoisomerase [Clostridiaceae bacterium]|jgi:1-deoxy-D-xylulose-5-phosphate reductoisomerase|nr:1-deoxy-D-xylulose-5-phosphate reductoisomerase [Clostridiaceae bacterium]